MTKLTKKLLSKYNIIQIVNKITKMEIKNRWRRIRIHAKSAPKWYTFFVHNAKNKIICVFLLTNTTIYGIMKKHHPLYLVVGEQIRTIQNT